MPAPVNDGTNRASLDRASPNTLPDLLRAISLGSVLAGQLPQQRRNVDMDVLGVSTFNLATLDALVLPDHAKAATVLRATVRAGAGGIPGELTPVAFGATPITTQIAVAPNGNIVTLGTDAITDMDVIYIPERGDVIDTVFPVVANVITLPASITARGVILLEEAAAVTPAAADKIILIPGAGAPAAGQARLDLAKATVTFAAADGVTRARVKLLVAPVDDDLCAVLEADAGTY